MYPVPHAYQIESSQHDADRVHLRPYQLLSVDLDLHTETQQFEDD